MLVVTGLSRSSWIGRIEARDLGRDRTLRRPTRQYVTHDDGTVDANGVCDSTPFAWRGESGGRSSIACAPLLLGRPRVQGRCTRFRSMQAGPRPDRSQPRSIGPGSKRKERSGFRDSVDRLRRQHPRQRRRQLPVSRALHPSRYGEVAQAPPRALVSRRSSRASNCRPSPDQSSGGR